jgi:hypothetical protein
MTTLHRCGLLVALLSTLATGCATSTPAAPPAEAVPLSASELRALLEDVAAPGRAFDDGYRGGLTYALQPGGLLTVTSGFVRSRSVTGAWRVDSATARLCTRVESDPEVCAPVLRLPGAPQRFYVDAPGGTQQGNTFVMR